MFKRVITAYIKPGKMPAAAQWAANIRDHVNKNYPDGKAEAFTEFFGETGVIHWFIDVESLAAIDERTEKLSKDEKYQALAAEGADYIIEGKGLNKLLRSI